MNKLSVVFGCLLVISGCSSQEKKCEDFEVNKNDVKACFDLQKNIAVLKQNTQERTTLEEQFKKQCVIESTIKAKEKVCESHQ